MIEVNIVEKKENPFLERTDLKVLVKHSSQPTPTREEIIKQISGKLKADASKVVIDYIFTETGKSESKVKAKVYKGKPPVRKVKKAEKKPEPEKKPAEKPKEEKPAVAKPEGKPKEPKPEKEVKEEKPKEKPKVEKPKEEKKVEEKKDEAQAK